MYNYKLNIIISTPPIELANEYGYGPIKSRRDLRLVMDMIDRDLELDELDDAYEQYLQMLAKGEFKKED
ncbi:MAG: hypothetical protein E7304_05890 [Butyrivibrio sp.]|nr:hypothetical protein [Butyrivibrio sp.]MBE5840922.1 hypothetical protein [Butyrivibrio sp.]